MGALRIDSGALRTLLTSPTGPVIRHVQSIASRVASRAPTLARRRSGNLHSNIRIELDTTGGTPFYRVIADVPYAMAEEEGAKPHIIRATSKAALHFFWEKRGGLETVVPRAGIYRGGRHRTFIKGGVLFIGKGYVNHPGTTGSHFLTRALEEVTRGGIA